MSTASNRLQSPFKDTAAPGYPADLADSEVPAWKAELNAKLAAHRQRRPGAPATGEHEQQRLRPDVGAGRASSVAARVAERYAKAPSYSEFLAASAAAAAAAAETAAFAARQAQEAEAVLARLTAAEATRQAALAHESFTASATRFDPVSSDPLLSDSWHADPPAGRQPWSPDRHATVEHPAPLPMRGIVPPRPYDAATGASPRQGGIVDAFAEAMVSPAVSLPAKLIEFPRELIAAHKSRPRIAEGPLAEEPSLRIFEVQADQPGNAHTAQPDEFWADARHDVEHSQPGSSHPGSALSYAQAPIEEASAFCRPSADMTLPLPDATRLATDAPENLGSGSRLEQHMDPEPDQRIADQPGESNPATHRSAASQDRRPPGTAPSEQPARNDNSWQSIRLGEHPASATDPQQATATNARPGQLSMPVLHTASLPDRSMSALVDLCVVAAAFLVFVLVFSLCTAHPPLDKTALICAALLLGVLLLFYEWLFLTYGGATLGMRYARIALCTFEDDNPTRSMRQRRVTASLLAMLPLGLGLLWVLFDEDSLGWHDRMARSYQRSYR